MKFSHTQVAKLSDISADVAQVILASIVIPFAIDKFDQIMLIWGLVVCVLFWVLSIYWSREKYE